MSAFLVEGYLSSATPGQLAADGLRAAAAAAALTAAGQPVVFLQAMYLPQEQTCLVLFDAAAPEQVAEACRRASIPCDRVTGALLAEPAASQAMAPASSTEGTARCETE